MRELPAAPHIAVKVGGWFAPSRTRIFLLLVVLGGLWLYSYSSGTPSPAPSPSAAPSLSAASFTAAVVAGSAEETPALIEARDAAVPALQDALPGAWTAATRGLGKLAIVSENPGIVITVLAATGTPHHKGTLAARRQSITLYVALRDETLTPGQLVSFALHELGHIWCCYGDGSDGSGHWADLLDDGRDYGLNRFGLMNTQLRCSEVGSRCPTRFSDRELQTMGFSAIPTATADPCVLRVDRLKAQLDASDADLAIKKRVLSDYRAQVASLRSTLDNRDAGQVARLNAVIAQENAAVDAYNRVAAASNALSSEYVKIKNECLAGLD